MLAAVAVVAVLGLLSVALSRPSAERQQENYDSQSSKQHADAQPPTADSAKQESDRGAKDQKQQQRGNPFSDYWQRFIEYVESRDKLFTALGTLIIAAFTVLLAVATLFLFQATRDLVKGADEAAEKQLREYVFVQEGAIVITPDGGGFIAEIDLKNFGKTPAKDFSTWLGGGTYDFDDLPFPKEPKPLTERVNRSIVGPEANIRITTESTALGDLVAIRNKAKAIFIWGALTMLTHLATPGTSLSEQEWLVPKQTSAEGAEDGS